MPQNAISFLEYTFESTAQPVQCVEVGRMCHELGRRETGPVLSTQAPHATACDIREWGHCTWARCSGHADEPITQRRRARRGHTGKIGRCVLCARYWRCVIGASMSASGYPPVSWQPPASSPPHRRTLRKRERPACTRELRETYGVRSRAEAKTGHRAPRTSYPLLRFGVRTSPATTSSHAWPACRRRHR